MAEVHTFVGELLRAAARTHPGRVRLNNEDLPLIDTARGIFGVIDGIGGQAGGEVAAATAKDVILQRLARPLGTPAERVREAIAIANNEIFRRAQESAELKGMACVVTLAIVADGRLTIGHVGDTRLYRIRPDGLQKLTRDHSPVGEREDAGELSEVDAMHHPRRHEVFRDIGTVHRDKDEQEFVDVVEEPLDSHSAILICSDGLSDMLPASTMAHIIRQHAGSPERVVEALVGAANDAGGRDNITVVYAEMPMFAQLVGGGGDTLAPTEPAMGRAVVPQADGGAADLRRQPSALGRMTRAILSSRITWFTVGALAGIVGALALTWYVAQTQVPSSQTLVVGPAGAAPFASIAAAVSAARPGDVVRVEPGVYREQVELTRGIDLVARVPHTVTIARPLGLAAPAPALTVGGTLNVRVSGVRVETPPDSPADVAVRIASPAATLELVEIAGPVRQALTLSPGSSVTLRGSRVTTPGLVMAVPDDGHAVLVNNVLTRTARSEEPAIAAGELSHLVLRGNVFSGFGAEVMTGVTDARKNELLEGNLIVPAEQERATAGRGTPTSQPRAGARGPQGRQTTPAGGRQPGRGR